MVIKSYLTDINADGCIGISHCVYITAVHSQWPQGTVSPVQENPLVSSSPVDIPTTIIVNHQETSNLHV